MLEEKSFENILKEKNFLLFKHESSFDIKFLRNLLPYMHYENLYKINIEGEVTKKDFNPILKLLELYFCEKRDELLNNIFEYLVNQKFKLKFKKVFRYSSKDLEKVKYKLFKTLISKDINFSIRYAKELFLRNEKDFENILLKFSLMSFNYKSSYALSLIKLIKMFPRALDELLQVFLVPYCNTENDFYFYNKAYFIKDEEIEKKFELLKIPYKLYINKETKEILKRLLDLSLKDSNSLIYLMQLESLMYFSRINENEEIFQRFILKMFIVLNESNNLEKEFFLKQYIIKSILA